MENSALFIVMRITVKTGKCHVIFRRMPEANPPPDENFPTNFVAEGPDAH
jgi:hypothetical protein